VVEPVGAQQVGPRAPSRPLARECGECGCDRLVSRNDRRFPFQALNLQPDELLAR
jgi:hypothetical protein